MFRLVRVFLSQALRNPSRAQSLLPLESLPILVQDLIFFLSVRQS